MKRQQSNGINRDVNVQVKNMQNQQSFNKDNNVKDQEGFVQAGMRNKQNYQNKGQQKTMQWNGVAKKYVVKSKVSNEVGNKDEGQVNGKHDNNKSVCGENNNKGEKRKKSNANW